MRFSIIVVTPDKQLRQLIGTRKSAVLPKGSLQNGYFQRNAVDFSVSSFAPSQTNIIDEFSIFLDSAARKYAGIMLLIDSEYQDLITEFEEAFFTVAFDRSLNGMNYQNYLGMILGKYLKNFSAYSQKFDDLKYRKILLLPFNSFKAQALADLKSLLTEENQSAGFGESLDEKIGMLSSRQRPKPARRNNKSA